MKLLYFASVREAIGLSSEEYDVPQDARTVGDLVAWISAGSQSMPAHYTTFHACGSRWTKKWLQAMLCLVRRRNWRSSLRSRADESGADQRCAN